MKAMRIILTAAAAVMTAFVLTGCVTNLPFAADSGNYTAGDFSTESEVKALDIDWVSGSVTVTASDDSGVTATETCSKTLKDEQKMQTWLEGTTLHIRYCKPGVNFNLTDAEKKLEVRVPKTILDSLKYDGTSADAEFSGISAVTFDADATSGNLILNGCMSDQLSLNTTSGSITAEQKESSVSLNAESTSGKITLHADEIQTLKISTTSGETELNVQHADSVKITGTSGTRSLTLGSMPAETTISGTSGDITLTVPQDAEFTASVDTVSGDFNSEISLAMHDKQYVSGNGANKLWIDTTSGNVSILAAE